MMWNKKTKWYVSDWFTMSAQKDIRRMIKDEIEL